MRRDDLPNHPKTSSLRLSAARLALACLALASVAACKSKSAEERGREAAEKMNAAMPDVEAIALAQNIDTGVCKEVQANLIVLNEYQGETNGTLDSVTVNAIQAFQRSAGLKDTGIVDDKTRTKLATAAQAAASK